jgi:predicted GNAT superfamily acetyltransferase
MTPPPSSPLSVPTAGSSDAIAASPLSAAARPVVDIRPLRTMAECVDCVELQRHVWGFGEADVVPATLLHVVDHVGGLAAGAFDSSGQLLGFVFGVSGVRDGELVHWSHMLGVRESARNLGLGRMLKEFQRTAMAKLGVRRISWSFDPLMAKNAYFNFDRLGASVVEYVPDMYGTTASPLHLGLPTDRLVVTTPTSVTGVERHPAGNGALPLLSPFPRDGDDVITLGVGDRRPDAVLIEVPSDILELTRRSPATARRWRLAVREHFQWALANDYRVASVRRDVDADREYYELVRRRVGEKLSSS